MDIPGLLSQWSAAAWRRADIEATDVIAFSIVIIDV
jgi:hypothetical protein